MLEEEKVNFAKEAARLHSTNPKEAVAKYAKLIGLTNFDPENWEDLRIELYSLIPPYLHPVSDAFSEYAFFIDPDAVEFNLSGGPDPGWVQDLEKCKIPEQLFDNVKGYIKKTRIELNRLREFESKYFELDEKMKEARKAYKSDESSAKLSAVRNSKVVRALGFSTGNAPTRIDAKKS